MDPEKVSSVGYGEVRPVATNETAAGRTRNRRIDLVHSPGPALMRRCKCPCGFDSPLVFVRAARSARN